MPTYEYACTACGHRLEAVQSFSDDPLTECPACGATLRKVYAPVGIVLKGSGFYKTDSRAAAGRQRLGRPRSPTTSTGGSSSSDSTTKKDAPASGGAGSKDGQAGAATAAT